jgi:hypothetical protein
MGLLLAEIAAEGYDAVAIRLAMLGRVCRDTFSPSPGRANLPRVVARHFKLWRLRLRFSALLHPSWWKGLSRRPLHAYATFLSSLKTTTALPIKN